ncbi:ATP phosphoribosyltransferase regulatory subunit [Azospira sp. I13]|uniref:ATP phosphoribosyltransferase regulatory subunit n=1 Tax=Azospira sp. I13 TaxID=1765050 RepID=UPI000D4B4336|nr:ATP phosphoribosyltransferase regulatory subunit [Azospira sp. I13]GBG01291.1 ATP phosphoribosyltransferase regulatory subunit [Azospira sp. I13]
MNWLLPEYLADALPAEAANIERLRRQTLDLFGRHGYELVMPPLLEYLESLLTGAGQDLRLKTFKLVDQLSGRTMGVRADITPQVARIDAHLLNRDGVVRLSYCGSVLHTLPAPVAGTRQPIQIGAEIYGYAGVEADLEIIRLMAASLAQAGLNATRLDLGHVGIFRAIAQAAGLPAEADEEVFALLQTKDVPGLQAACAGLPESYRSALLRLTELYGDAGVLERARRTLPDLPAVTEALDTLSALAARAADLPIGFDLSDLRGYHYHNGLVFAAYTPGYASALALGGRYDGAGEAFGRARPATGFSMDLREVARLAPVATRPLAILAPCNNGDDGLAAVIAELRARGEAVVELLPGQQAGGAMPCDRRLEQQSGKWIIAAINKD